MAKASVEQLDKSVSGGFTPATPGAYDSIIIASIDSVSEFEGKKKNVTQFLFQITEDETQHIVRSAGFVPSLHEKSGFLKFLSGWFKTKDVGAIKAALEKVGIIADGELDMEKFVGRKCGLLISNKVSKAGKDYAAIESYMPIKNKEIKLIPGKIPAFYLEGTLGYKVIEGMTYAKDEPTAADTAAPLDMNDLASSLMD